jgi:hypothetical protein
VRLKIVRSPVERELDGLKLDGFLPGLLVDVTPSVALWLIAQDYAVLEMRQPASEPAGDGTPLQTDGDRRRS